MESKHSKHSGTVGLYSNLLFKRMYARIKAYLGDYHIAVNVLLKHTYKIFSDELYLKLKFRNNMGYWMDFKNPKTYNEKLQWFKLNDKHPEYTQMVDKVAAKEYVATIMGGVNILFRH